MMDADHYRRAEALFHDALRRPPAERAGFLDEACAADPALRATVERLLRADAETEEGAPPIAVPLRPTGLPAGRTVGPYRVVRPLGQGGMGEVLLAVREAPYRRTVALKVVRDGGRSAEARARFAVERQVLASLDHAGIARLYDGGVTDPEPGAPEGLPYLALEYVEGAPLTEACDARRLGVEERLRLFVQVCEAVHYAHQNLVLHRDLKPSNVLVTPEGRVKLLDFGIAKLLDPGLSAVPAPQTRTGVRLMTPEYASPEQIRGETLSTATDVYSLGVLLYELLTGQRPHRLSGRTADEVMRTVSETPPTTPSTVVLEPPDAPAAEPEAGPAEAAALRGLTPERLARRLSGDLDAICLRALRKEPGRRYGSAELLAQDVERHLAQQPVVARRGTRRYRLGAFLRRHRVEAAAALAVLLALVGGLGAALWQASEASRERDLARTEAAKSEEVAGFLTGLFEQGDPTKAAGDTITVREVLGDAVARIDGLDGQPEVQASLLTVIATAYGNLGRADAARPLFERAFAVRLEALGADHPQTIEARHNLGHAHLTAQDYEAAVPLFRRHLADVRRLHGDDAPETLVIYDDLADALHLAGRADEAAAVRQTWIDLVEQAQDLDDPLVATSLSEYGRVLLVRHESEEAEQHLRRAIAIARRSPESSAVDLGSYLRYLATALLQQEKYAEAEQAAREALALMRPLYPEGHASVAGALLELGQSLAGQGQYAAARAVLEEHLAMLRRLNPDGHPTVAASYGVLARLEQSAGRRADAVRWQRASVAEFERLQAPDALPLATHRLLLAELLIEQRSYAEAETILLRALRLARTRDTSLFFTQARVSALLADLYEAWGRPAEAARYRIEMSPTAE